MRYLSELTGDPKYWKKAKFAMEKILRAPKKDGLVPLFMESVAKAASSPEKRPALIPLLAPNRDKLFSLISD